MTSPTLHLYQSPHTRYVAESAEQALALLAADLDETVAQLKTEGEDFTQIPDTEVVELGSYDEWDDEPTQEKRGGYWFVKHTAAVWCSQWHGPGHFSGEL